MVGRRVMDGVSLGLLFQRDLLLEWSSLQFSGGSCQIRGAIEHLDAGLQSDLECIFLVGLRGNLAKIEVKHGLAILRQLLGRRQCLDLHLSLRGGLHTLQRGQYRESCLGPFQLGPALIFQPALREIGQLVVLVHHDKTDRFLVSRVHQSGAIQADGSVGRCKRNRNHHSESDTHGRENLRVHELSFSMYTRYALRRPYSWHCTVKLSDRSPGSVSDN